MKRKIASTWIEFEYIADGFYYQAEISSKPLIPPSQMHLNRRLEWSQL